MAANTQPIFGRTPDVQLSPILGPTAVTATNGTGALEEIFQADPDEGSYIDNITVKPCGGSTAATVMRLFLCSVTGTFTSGTSNTASNTNMIAEITIPVTTASNSAAAGEWAIPLRRAIPPGWRLLVGFGTSTGAAGVGFCCTTWGSKY